jgi:hypothetical protein
MAKGKKLDTMAIVGYAALGEPLVDQLFANFAGNLGMSDDLLKLGAGYYLKGKSGLVGKIGMAMFVIQAYKFGKVITSGGLNLLGVGATSNDGW